MSDFGNLGRSTFPYTTSENIMYDRRVRVLVLMIVRLIVVVHPKSVSVDPVDLCSSAAGVADRIIIRMAFEY
jgi:hypothetical protein